ncbi:MAG TPA: TolC family protein [Pyrinomonadaceae bacterium]|nr:TolC family protein [Pyrinomonadaceae bacterium]
MHRHSYFFIIMTLVLASGAPGQTPTPTPSAAVLPEDLQAAPSIAPNYRSESRTLPDLGRVGIDAARQRTLTLGQAIELTLVNNRDIEVTRKTAEMAEFDLRAARGFYQPRLTGQSFYERSTVANVSIFSNNPETTQSSIVGNAALQFFARSQGTVFSGGFNNTRLSTDNPISILSPQYNSSLSFSVAQPLFRGRRFDQPRRIIEIARRNIELSDTQFRSRSIESVAAVQRTYWDLTFALRNLQVQRDGLRDAKAQLEHNRRLVDEGQLAPIDIVAAETQVANFEQAVYDALNLVNQAENGLKNLISPNRADEIWSEAIMPVEAVEVTVPNTTLGEAMQTAMDNRPELEINAAQKAINAVDQRLFRDQKKPQIDLVASYSSSGIGGSQNPNFSPNFPTPCSVDPASPACAQQQANLALLTGNPLSGIFANRYPVLRVGVNFNLPLFGDKTAEANLGRSLVEAERLEIQREQIEQGIQLEVRNALQAIRTREAQLRSAAIARENSERQYASEQRKLDEGQSDVYKVLERQTALTVARSNELRARTELNKAVADLQRAMGYTLKANNIEAKR